MADREAASSTGTMLIQIVIVILGLVGLYYLYKFLYASDIASVALISGKQDAKLYGPKTIGANAMPPLYKGGEFSISTWINITDYAHARANNKSIIRIGRDGTNDFIRIYLGAITPQLMVRFNVTGSDLPNPVVTTTTTETTPPPPVAFTETQTEIQTISTTTPYTLNPTNGTDANSSCDILQIDMQRWIHIVVCVNGMSCDVYLDGKLARSCPLPNYPAIVGQDYKAKILDTGGFAGYISTTNIYSQSLSPDIVYQSYMAGPEPVTNLFSYLYNFFSPSAAY